jgi:hypothetical protein
MQILENGTQPSIRHESGAGRADNPLGRPEQSGGARAARISRRRTYSGGHLHLHPLPPTHCRQPPVSSPSRPLDTSVHWNLPRGGVECTTPLPHAPRRALRPLMPIWVSRFPTIVVFTPDTTCVRGASQRRPGRPHRAGHVVCRGPRRQSSIIFLPVRDRWQVRQHVRSCFLRTEVWHRGSTGCGRSWRRRP